MLFEEINEVEDVLPQYKKYCELKKQYQLGQISEVPVLASLEILVVEIIEFLKVLNNNTDISAERQLIDKIKEAL